MILLLQLAACCRTNNAAWSNDKMLLRATTIWNNVHVAWKVARICCLYFHPSISNFKVACIAGSIVKQSSEIWRWSLVPTPCFGSHLCRQNVNRSPTQYRQLRRLTLKLILFPNPSLACEQALHLEGVMRRKSSMALAISCDFLCLP